MNTRRWEWNLADLAILCALFIVINPELRVFLFLVDFLGLELIFFLVLIQLRSFLPITALALNSAGKWSCMVSFAACRGILRVFAALLPGRASTLLFILSQSLWCPLSRRSGLARLHT
jgi:hypothetical protein